MKWKTRLKKFYYVALSSIAGGLIGIVSGILIHEYIVSSWRHKTLSVDIDSASEILLVDYHYLSTDYTENTVYVQTQSENIYSIYKEQMTLLPPIEGGFSVSELYLLDEFSSSPIAVTHQGEDFQFFDGGWRSIKGLENSYWKAPSNNCAREWRYPPPIRGKVIDSEGFQFEHALARSEICYAIMDDGSLQVWTRTPNAFSLILTVGTSVPVGMIIGLIVGVRKYV